MSVTYWVFDYGGYNEYRFERNPDRKGGDTGWIYEPRMTSISIAGANFPNLQVDGFNNNRTIKFTAIHGTMMRTLQNFYLSNATIENCRDHLYPTTISFSCFITGFAATMHPTIGAFPGSGEDTYDVEITLTRMS